MPEPIGHLVPLGHLLDSKLPSVDPSGQKYPAFDTYFEIVSHNEIYDKIILNTLHCNVGDEVPGYGQ